MKQNLDLITCPTCKGFGSLPDESGFHEAGQIPPVSVTCPNCNGEGRIPKRFFVEFLFDSLLSNRRYWLPLLIVTADIKKANELILATRNALSERYTNIDHSKPIPEAEATQALIHSKYKGHSMQKLAVLNIDVWKFKDIEPNPDWSFDEHLNYIGNNLPLENKLIARRIQSHQFPVRIIKDKFPPVDFKEFLLIHVVQS